MALQSPFQSDSGSLYRSSVGNCSPSSDNAFGPFSDCRYDFTQLFEQCILSTIPALLFTFVAPIRLRHLYIQDKKVIEHPIRIVKLLLTIVLAGMQLVLLTLWCLSKTGGTAVSIPFAFLDLLAALLIVPMSQLEHARSVRPSSILIVYLLFALILDLPLVRTLCSQDELKPIAGVFATTVGLKLAVLLVEMQDKILYLKSEYKDLSLEYLAGIINRSFMWWLNGIFTQGYQSVRLFLRVYRLDEDLTAEHLGQTMQRSWEQKSQREGRFVLVAAIWRTLWRQFTIVIFPRLCLIGFTFAQPFLITQVLELTVGPEDEAARRKGYLLIAATAITYLGIALSSLHASHNLYRFITMFRGATVSIIYNQTLLLDKDADGGCAAVTLMSVDVDRIAFCLEEVNECWSRLIEVFIGIPLLTRQVGWVSIIPLLVVGLSATGSGVIARHIGSYQKTWADATQRRIHITSSALEQIKNIKMMGLSKNIGDMIQNERFKETKKMEAWAWVIVWKNVIANVPFVIAPAATFAVYAIKAKLGGSSNLDSTQAFTSLALIILVSNPASRLLAAVPNIAASVGCFDRIQAFLLAKSRKDQRILSCNPSFNKPSIGEVSDFSSNSEFENLQGDVFLSSNDSWMILVENATIRPVVKADFALRNLNLRIEKRSITMIVGGVGVGKTTVLKAILGEICCEQGSIFIKENHMAYCSQTSWLPNGTIRQVICGIVEDGSIDEEWYLTTIDVCALRYDISNLSAGDKTVIGSKGITLSGGQKQRITLARALYSRPKIFILDDILSALDKRTEMTVVKRLFQKNGIFHKLGSTVILVTHATKYLSFADQVISISTNGTIRQGTYHDIAKDGHAGDRAQDENSCELASIDSSTKVFEAQASDAVADQARDLKRQTGDLTIYKYYFRSIGAVRMLVFLLFAILNTLSWSFSQIWLKWWTDIEGRQITLYTAIYFLLGVGYCLGNGGFVWAITVVIGPSTGRKLHRVLLETVMRAPLSFFAKTDLGTILNRFSQDMALIEGQLAIGILVTVTNLLACLAEAALVSLGSSYMATTAPFFMVAIYFLKRIYLRTSQQLRILDLEKKSPLYSHFLETLDGLSTIRAFGWEKEAAVVNARRLDDSQIPHYLMYCIQRWLALMLDLLVGAMAVTVVALATLVRNSTSTGLLGVSLNNILAFNGSVSAFITGWTILETSLGAIARLRDLEAETEVESKKGENFEPSADWPSHGLVEVQDVAATYNSSQPALQDISITIQPGQKIGICGRTGSGKSSLLSIITRLLDLSSGTIKIDSVDLSTVSRDTIRRRMTIIPQDPLHLTGTMRLNVDPFNTSSDHTIIEALTRVGLWAVMVERGGLDTDLSSDTLSKGEQQLFALARAILQKSKILLLDEATSSIDGETDQILQKLIREEFKDCTVLTVAHRMDSIIDSDLVVVMEGGRIAESGKPLELMADEGSAYRKLLEV